MEGQTATTDAIRAEEANPSLRGAATRGVFWSFAGVVTQAALQLGTVALLARMLTPAEFGVIGGAQIVIGVLTIVAQLGVAQALVHTRDLRDAHLGTATVLSMVLGVLLGVVCFVSSAPVARLFGLDGMQAILAVLALIFPVRAIATVNEALLQRSLRFRALSAIETASYAVGYVIVGVAMAAMGYGVWALVGATLGQAVARTALILYHGDERFRISWDRDAGRSLANYGSGLMFAQLAHAAALHGDNFVVGKWMGSAALGVYSRAYQLLVMPASMVASVLDRVLFPILAQIQDQKQRLALAYGRSVGLTALIMIPTSGLLLILAPEVIALLLGPRWTSAVAPLQVLSIGLLFRTSFQLGDSLARSLGAVYQSSWRQAVYAIAVIGGAWVGRHWGLAGVASGVLFALMLKFLLMAHLAVRLTPLTWRHFFRAHATGMALGSAVALGAWTTATLLRNHSAPAAVVVLVVPAALFVLTALLWWWWPKAFLGIDGQWLFGMAAAAIPASRREALRLLMPGWLVARQGITT